MPPIVKMETRKELCAKLRNMLIISMFLIGLQCHHILVFSLSLPLGLAARWKPLRIVWRGIWNGIYVVCKKQIGTWMLIKIGIIWGRVKPTDPLFDRLNMANVRIILLNHTHIHRRIQTGQMITKSQWATNCGRNYGQSQSRSKLIFLHFEELTE